MSFSRKLQRRALRALRRLRRDRLPSKITPFKFDVTIDGQKVFPPDVWGSTLGPTAPPIGEVVIYREGEKDSLDGVYEWSPASKPELIKFRQRIN